ncbi:hypothetical protein BT63DRAFT_413869 [Microthyrium microscopicum]|uniref:Uncharacterized protein n=1 Tax=Microthyrium microscopicum TaxID=703497 RepID=A0A6A6UBZ9_9PEZI|nr:hypothetical protein BT63DRAFT_413869 [Microthyrium microscopicum]
MNLSNRSDLPHTQTKGTLNPCVRCLPHYITNFGNLQNDCQFNKEGIEALGPGIVLHSAHPGLQPVRCSFCRANALNCFEIPHEISLTYRPGLASAINAYHEQPSDETAARVKSLAAQVNALISAFGHQDTQFFYIHSGQDEPSPTYLLSSMSNSAMDIGAQRYRVDPVGKQAAQQAKIIELLEENNRYLGEQAEYRRSGRQLSSSRSA